MTKKVIVYAYLYNHQEAGLSKNIAVTADDDMDDEALLDATIDHYRETFFDTVEAQVDIVEEEDDDLYIDDEIDISNGGE